MCLDNDTPTVHAKKFSSVVRGLDHSVQRYETIAQRGSFLELDFLQASQVYDSVTAGLQEFYRTKLLPIEKDHLFHQFYSPELTDAEKHSENQKLHHGTSCKIGAVLALCLAGTFDPMFSGLLFEHLDLGCGFCICTYDFAHGPILDRLWLLLAYFTLTSSACCP